MVDFAPSPEITELRKKVSAFMESDIYPNEDVLDKGGPEAASLMKELQAKTRALGMWAVFIGPEAGGTGTGFLPYVYVNEILGRSPYAPRAFGCAAPDTGNAEILHQFGTQEQKERWLAPLVAGEIRSCFSMTEPDVSGADPTGLQTTAVRDGDDWVINGHKWFTSGAIGAAFAIVMCVTERACTSTRTHAASGPASACSGECGQVRGAFGRCGSRRPIRRACSSLARDNPRSGSRCARPVSRPSRAPGGSG